MFRRTFLRSSLQSATTLFLSRDIVGQSTLQLSSTAPLARSDWVHLLERVAKPVLEAAAQGHLQQLMPVEAAPNHIADRRPVTCLEAVARTLAGVAPWLESGPKEGEEGQLRSHFADLAQQAITTGVVRGLPGFLNFGEDRQTIVDAGFLALALARAPRNLRAALSDTTRHQLADALRATRQQSPPFNNWLLFAAMIEAALLQLGEPWDRVRVDYALRQHAAWFLGDGTYGDGPHYHADYYNSFVIHPFLLALIDIVALEDGAWSSMRTAIHERARRYAALQERAIAPDGTFPAVGRSLTYRCGAFHLLADISRREALPETLPPEQVRSALNAVLRRTLLAPGTFDESGWLRIGLAGHQPSLGETYISTGSLYLCTAVFLPLALPAQHRFWSGPEIRWTSAKVWNGEDLSADHAQD